MKPLYPTDLVNFARQYRFQGAQIRRLKICKKRGAIDLDIYVVARTSVRDLSAGSKPVRLHFQLKNVSEFRLQKRLSNEMKSSDIHFGSFGGDLFINLDAWGLEPGERPGVHDFRASELYAGGQALYWEEVKAKPK